MSNEEKVRRIKLLYRIAKINDAILSVNDVAKLVDAKLTPEHLTELFEKEPSLSNMKVFNQRFVLAKDESDDYLAKALVNRSRAKSYISSISPLIGWMRTNSLVLAVSGSLSYSSIRQTDDIDLFCITEDDFVWIFMLKSLLLARLYRIIRKNVPPICLSCTLGKSFAYNFLTKSDDPLLARDALTAIVIHGNEFYSHLIESSRWMEKYFPTLYKSSIEISGLSERSERRSLIRKILNSFLFHTVGRYVLFKAYLSNRILAKKKRKEDSFKVIADVGHCIYESRRYMKMRHIYREFLCKEETFR